MEIEIFKQSATLFHVSPKISSATTSISRGVSLNRLAARERHGGTCDASQSLEIAL